MGVDAEIYVYGPVSDAELEGAQKFVRDRVGEFAENPPLQRGSDLDGRPTVYVDTLSHYYGPGYERGDWPVIYGAIRALQAALPYHPVHYGGDSADSHPEATDEVMAAIWEHYLGPDGNAYYDR